MKAPVKAPPALRAALERVGRRLTAATTAPAATRLVGSHDLTARTAGLPAGLDYRLTPDTVAGFALAGGGTNWGLAQGLGGGRSDAFQAGVYGATRSGPAYLAGRASPSPSTGCRPTASPFGDHLTADFNAQSSADASKAAIASAAESAG